MFDKDFPETPKTFLKILIKFLKISFKEIIKEMKGMTGMKVLHI